MPVIKSAKKKLRVDKKRESSNKKVQSLMEIFIKKAEKNPSIESVKKAVSIVDKSVKKNIIHKNKAARIKSRLSKLIGKKIETTDKNKKVKKIAVKKAKKGKK
jgi:small subunit ribosomal protein S20